MTHNLGHMRQSKSYALSILCQCCYHLMPVCMTSVSSKWHHNITTQYHIRNKSFYPSCQCNSIIIMPDTYKKTENWCSKSVAVPIYVLLCHSNQQTDQKLHKNYKCSALPLFLAINCSIYYLINGTFSQAYDVNQ